MNITLVPGIVSGLFLLWHRRWFSRTLSKDEITLRQSSRHSRDHEAIDDQGRESFLSFLEADDGKPLYMVNLMQYRDKAFYPAGRHTEVTTGRHVNALCAKAVVRELIKNNNTDWGVSRL